MHDPDEDLTREPGELAPKPHIEGMPPEEGVPAPTDEQEAELPEVEFMSHDVAVGDDTVDISEDDTVILGDVNVTNVDVAE